MIQPFEFHSMIKKLHKLLLPLAAILMMSPKMVKSQNEGDTLRVKTFHYGSNTRDTVANFPKGDLSYEKIILRYSMRCKNGLISDGSNRNKGCGEWDYSCNTFLVDSSQIEVVPQTAQKFVVSNFTGTSFAYTTKPVSDYYDYGLKKVEVLSASNVLKYTIGNGKESVSQALNTTQKSGKTLMLYKAQELLDAGFSAGDMQGFSFMHCKGALPISSKFKSNRAAKINWIPMRQKPTGILRCIAIPWNLPKAISKLFFIRHLLGMVKVICLLNFHSPIHQVLRP